VAVPSSATRDRLPSRHSRGGLQAATSPSIGAHRADRSDPRPGAAHPADPPRPDAQGTCHGVGREPSNMSRYERSEGCPKHTTIVRILKALDLPYSALRAQALVTDLQAWTMAGRISTCRPASRPPLPDAPPSSWPKRSAGLSARRPRLHGAASRRLAAPADRVGPSSRTAPSARRVWQPARPGGFSSPRLAIVCRGRRFRGHPQAPISPCSVLPGAFGADRRSWGILARVAPRPRCTWRPLPNML
jgi:hypothetical protein